MTTANERYALVGRKIERAEEHIRDLKAASDTFLRSNPYEISSKRNPQTRQLIYYVSSINETPPCLATITGDVLQNLRSALDHLAYQLFLVGPQTGDGFRVQFPIERCFEIFERTFERKIQSMRKEAKDAIRALEPFKGGAGHEFWVLHQMNNIDKHRLVLTVGSAFQSLGILHRLIDDLRKITPFEVPDMPLPNLRPADRKCPLKVGDELFIDGPDAEPDQKVKFAFGIALHEPEVVESKPLIETVRGFTDLVSNTVSDFRPLLS